MTCHYNGQGGGPLNDYGRALFSAEIASRAFYDPQKTDEQIAEESGFLGKTKLPWWFRPGIKYRGLWFQTDPGTSEAKSRYITMQADANLALLFDQDQKFIFVGSYGYLPASGPGEKPDWISREHYFRWGVKDNLFAYVGLMDKVFGIRTVDHTSYSRSKTELAQNDQSDGVLIQWMPQPMEYNLQVFIGNLSQQQDLRQKGVSFMAENDLNQFHRVGGAILYSKNDYLSYKMAEVHSKWGYGKGQSFLSELGYIGKTATGHKTDGAYVMLENLSLLKRGYNLLSQVEYYNETMTKSSPDLLKWSFGFLMFPAPRVELRAGVVNERSMTETGVKPDHWSIQGQAHLSL